MYSTATCKDDFLLKYLEESIIQIFKIKHIRQIIHRFLKTGSDNKGKSHKKPTVTDVVVEDPSIDPTIAQRSL